MGFIPILGYYCMCLMHGTFAYSFPTSQCVCVCTLRSEALFSLPRSHPAQSYKWKAAVNRWLFLGCLATGCSSWQELYRRMWVLRVLTKCYEHRFRGRPAAVCWTRGKYSAWKSSPSHQVSITITVPEESKQTSVGISEGMIPERWVYKRIPNYYANKILVS